MRINREQIVDKNSLVGYMVLHCLSKSWEAIDEVGERGHAEVCLTIDGKEVDLQEFVDHWQSQIERMIQEEAKNMVEEKFNKVRDSMFEFTNALEQSLQELNKTK